MVHERIIEEDEVAKMEKKITFLQFVNTALLTIMCGSSILVYSTMNKISDSQDYIEKEMVRMKTVQDNNVANVSSLSLRVFQLETNDKEFIQSWVESNFMRKPQK
jgi:hypothetical protein